MKDEGQPVITPQHVSRYLLPVLDTTPDVVFVKDLAGRHVYINRAGVAALGHSRPEDVIGRTNHEVQPAEIADHFERHDEQIRRTGETVQVEEVAESADGRQTFMVTKGPCIDEHGKVIGTYGIARNVTEQRQLKEQLEQLAGFDHVYKTAPVGLCLMDLDLRFVRINERLAEINGRLVAEHIGRTLREVIPEIAEKVEPLYRRVIHTGDPILDVEVVGTTPADPSSEKEWLVSYYPVKDDRGSVKGISTVVQEITEIKKAQQTLLRSEERFRALVEHSPDAIVVLDVETDLFVDVNQNAVDLFGLDREKLLTIGPLDVSPPMQPGGRPSADVSRKIRAEAPRRQLTFKWLHRHADGHEIPCEIRLVRLPDPNRVLLRASITDISERVAAETALEESEEKYRVIAETATDAIMTINEDSTIVYANSATEKIFGYSVDELHNRSLTSLMPESMRPLHLESLSAFVVTGEKHVPWEGLMLRALHKSGREFPVEISFGSMRRETGELLFTGIIRDITERVRADEALRDREAELQESQIELQRLAGRLISAHEEERKRIARELHDDLTQRLAAMAIEAGKLERESMSLSAPFSKKLQDLRMGIAQLADDTQSVSRRLHPSILDDLGLVDAIASECAGFSKREGIEVRFVPAKLPRSLPNSVSLCLYRVTQESLRNIAKHSRAKTAEVCLVVEDHSVKLSIRDTGIGFVPSQVRKKGGLGLASMKERVRLIQGSLEVTSQKGEGTRIEIEAPLRGDDSQTAFRAGEGQE